MAVSTSGSLYRDTLRQSVEDVDACDLSGTDRAVALAVLLAARLGLGNLSSATTPMTPGNSDRTDQGDDRVTADRSEPVQKDVISRICAATKLEREVAELMYDSNGSDLSYVISAKRLAPSKSEATRQLAQIIALGRQTAGLEEWTPSSTIREVVQEYGKFDSANFASHLQGLDRDNAVLFRGKGANRELKVTRAGVESMTDALRALVAG